MGEFGLRGAATRKVRIFLVEDVRASSELSLLRAYNTLDLFGFRYSPAHGGYPLPAIYHGLKHEEAVGRTCSTLRIKYDDAGAGLKAEVSILKSKPQSKSVKKKSKKVKHKIGSCHRSL